MEIVIVKNDKNNGKCLEESILKIDPSAQIICIYDKDELMNKINHLNKRAVFIIQLTEPFSYGIHIAKSILNYYYDASIIFVSSSLDASRYVYDVNHSYFIYEPDLDAKLLDALNKASNKNERVTIISKGKTLLIPCSDIIFFERDLRQTIIHLEDKTIRTYENLKCYDQQTGPHFLECHRSFIVNLKKVIEYHRTYFIMSNGLRVPISRSHEKHTKAIFEQYCMND